MEPGENMYSIEYSFKAILATILAAYFGIQGTTVFLKITDDFFTPSMDKKFKSAGNNYDYIIAGGSNALVGLSAQELSRKTGYSAYNLAISSCEGAGLLNYPEWLEQSSSGAKTLVYSSMNFWYLGKKSPCLQSFEPSSYWPLKQPLISVPLIRTALNKLKKWTFEINDYGDFTVKVCDQKIPEFEAEYAETNTINQEQIANFINTIAAAKDAVKADEILVRVPPIYVLPQSLPKFKAYIAFVNEKLSEQGMSLLGSDSALTTDSTKMCFGSNHPTAQARQQYTESLIQELVSHRLFASQ